MPHQVPGHTLDYLLVAFDEHGEEVPPGQDVDGTAAALAQAADGVTDVFLLSHGWKGDIAAALRQCDSWLKAMLDLPEDERRWRESVPGYRPLVVGLHWPSLPWGDETDDGQVLGDAVETDDAATFAREAQLPDGRLQEQYAGRIADTPDARAALARILAAAEDPATAAALEQGQLPPDVAAAYDTLFDEAGLGAGGAAAAPGADQEGFDPALSLQEWSRAAGGAEVPDAQAPQGDLVLGLGDALASLRNKLLMPLRQLSFWQMKHRARTVGEAGVHTFLADLERAAPEARVHVMGHSFGCIVVSAAIAGPVVDDALADPLPRPVDTLFLVQGAMSLWSYADRIPFGDHLPGYYRALRAAPGQVRGVVATTQSTKDWAVGRLFPLGARLSGDEVLDAEQDFPEYGGVGAFGLQGTPVEAVGVLGTDGEYGFTPGTVYNVDCTSVIPGHNDIMAPAVAHLMWQAVIASTR